MSEDAIGVVREIYAALNRGDPSVFDLLDEHIEWVTPATLPWTVSASDGTYRGHGQLIDYFRNCVAQVDGLRVDIDEIVPAGDRVLVTGFERGRCRATGRTFRARFMQVWTVADGKAKRLEGFPDTASMTAAFQTATGSAGDRSPG